MRLTGLLLVVFLLSLFLVTDARLRFKDETTSCENEADFECEPGVCINATLKCNSAYDCESLADESVLLCGCPSGEFRCQNSCIPLQQRCDGECNCAVNCADEENCNSFHCLPGFQKCKNGLCHPTYVWCDFYNDCGDMSDEANCERPDCWFTEYQCDNKQCINSFFVCDGIEDCADGSDEGNSTCSEDKFADCGDGTRVHKHNFCDGMADCPLNEADESNCQCKAKAEFQCNNSKCLPRAKKCDRRCDCLDCEDEDGCENKDNCDTDDHFFCPMIKEWEHMLPVCLRKEFICDGYGDCDKTEADELCFDGEGPPDCSAKGLIGCGAGDPRCLPPFTKCDKTLHCLGGFDEKQNCSAPSPCQPGQFRCRRGGRCFNETIRCDTYTDCFDGSDEEDCESFVCPADTWKCAAGHCIPYSFLCDFRLDCYYHKNGTKDISDETSCSTSHYIRPSSTERGRSVGFVKVGDRSCEEDEWQCRSGQCIEAWRRCFAHSDDEFGGCADKSHLRNCSDFVCPDGSFKCARSHCIESSQVCDRKINCIESWDDETQDLNDCTQECSSSGCNCSHFDMHCSNLGLHGSTFNINAQDTRLIKHFYLEGNSMGYLLEDGNALSGLTRMILLDLSNNNISFINKQALLNVPHLQTLRLADNSITSLGNNTFSNLQSLMTLVLRGNSMSTLEEKAFIGLRQLTILDLSHQNIQSFQKMAFAGLTKLSNLNMSHNSLTDIPRGAFFGLNELEKLDIRHNKLQKIHAEAFYGLPKLRELYTDEYRFCCMARDMVSLEKCEPQPGIFSSCEDLMANVFLRGSIWVIGIMASVGNLVVILMRMNNKRDNRFFVRQAPLADIPELVGPTWVHSFLITNLAIGDFCMGVYLLIIAAVDSFYRGHYIIYDKEWRNSGLCHFAGFLSTFSSELSVFSLTIITLHRLLSILFPFRIKDIEYSGAVRVMVVAWLIVIFLAVLPLTGVPYFGNFYGRSGVCLALHITRNWPPGWEYSVFIFLVVNFISFATIAASYSVMFVVARRTQKAVNRTRDANTGDAMARRMTLIVMTDFVCWAPIILLGVASLGGANIPNEVYAWIAVFVLPVNSAVNPMLYTLLTARYVRRVMSRARTSLNLSLSTMTTDMKQVNFAGDRQSRMSNGRQGWQKGIRLPKADPNRNAIKLTTIASLSDTEPDEAARVEEFNLLRDDHHRSACADAKTEGEARPDGVCRARDEKGVEDDIYDRNV